MKVNRYRPHVLVLPEDDANRQLANGFLLEESLLPSRIQVLDEVGGWTEVLDRFKSDQVSEMDGFPNRFVVLLIDFDGKEDRLDRARREIPERLNDRVFVLGTWTQPEALRRAIGSYETVGRALAKDCREDTNATWGHQLLRHNASEIDRLRQHVRPILFQPT
jgi:hypothetical protein